MAGKGTDFYIGKVRDMNDEYFQKNGKRRLFLCKTFGCQMNAHDSEKITGMLLEMGYGRAEREKDASLIIFNTCCVRENAENKVFGNLGYLKNLKEINKDLKILVCGCMTQQDAAVEKIKNSYRNVDVIFGTFNLHRLPELLLSSYETGGTVIDVWEEHGEINEDLPTEREFKFKASVNIMYGCNNFCSYCIVPFVRGRERSRAAGDILKEIEELAKDGVKEILLLGQNVNSYRSMGVETDFAGLLGDVSNVRGIERIRFMTSHPKDLSDSLIEAIKCLDKVCKHLHIPFQSGSSAVLAKMNRHYTKEQYISLIDKVKRAVPQISLTTDIIVGFPGETEEDFRDTLDIVNYVRFATAYTFYYSKRTGTPAAKMDNQVPENVVKERFDRLLDAVNPIAYELNKSFEGQTLKVLVETHTDEVLTGRADNNSLVHFNGDENLIGDIVDVRITEGKPFYLMGTAVE